MSNLRLQDFGNLALDVAWLAIMIVYDFVKHLVFWIIPSAPKDIRGKTVMVTGSASGLGRALSLRLASHGCRLVLVDINQQQNSQVAEEARAAGSPHVSCFTCDVSDRDAVMRLAQEAPHVDILINNAGIISTICLPGNEKSEKIRHLFEVNTISHFWMVQAFLPGMLERDSGHIVAIASISGLIPGHTQIAYITSKHAVVGFMAAFREELRNKGRQNIKTTVACTYFFKTPYVNDAFELRIPALPVEEVATGIIDGIRREKTIIIMPKLLAVLRTLKDIFPECVVDRVKDFFWFRMKQAPNELADEATFVGTAHLVHEKSP